MARFGLAPTDRYDVAAKEVDILALASAFSFCGLFGSPINMPSSAVLAATLLRIVGAR